MSGFSDLFSVSLRYLPTSEGVVVWDKIVGLLGQVCWVIQQTALSRSLKKLTTDLSQTRIRSQILKSKRVSCLTSLRSTFSIVKRALNITSFLLNLHFCWKKDQQPRLVSYM